LPATSANGNTNRGFAVMSEDLDYGVQLPLPFPDWPWCNICKIHYPPQDNGRCPECDAR
jgi:hypothetical protein